MKRSYTYLVVPLVGIVVVLALAYIIEVNELSEAKAALSDEQGKFKELTLANQESIQELSLLKMGKHLERLQEELRLEQVKNFSLIESKANQLSLRKGYNQTLE